MRCFRLPFLILVSLALASCSTSPKQEGLVGPEVNSDPPEEHLQSHGEGRQDPNEVNVDVVKYKKKF